MGPPRRRARGTDQPRRLRVLSRAGLTAPCVLYAAECSYYSAKARAYLLAKQVPYVERSSADRGYRSSRPHRRTPWIRLTGSKSSSAWAV